MAGANPFAAVEIAAAATAAVGAVWLLAAWARCQRRAAAEVRRHHERMRAEYRRDELMRALAPDGQRDPLSGLWEYPDGCWPTLTRESRA